MAEAIMLQLAGREVRISSPDKVFFPKAGQTKLDLVDFYCAVEGPLMEAVGGRPFMVQRFPDGVKGKSFFQKRVPKGAPDWLQTTTVSTVNGTPSEALVMADIAHMAWAANMGSLGFHPWPFKATTPQFTDELRIDLDPSPKVTFDMVRAGAQHVKRLLDELSIDSYIKTSGSKGLHVYVRLRDEWDSYQVRAGAVALARELERREPELMTWQWWKEERGRRVFVDYNQNAPHKTVFGTWAVRPRVGAQVSTPLFWDEVDTVMPDELTMDVVPARLDSLGNPWADMNANPQDLTPLLDMYDADIANGMMDAPWPPVYPKQPNEPPRVSPSRAKKEDTNR